MKNITIHGQNMNVTPALEEYAQEKLGKLDRYLPNIADLRLDLSQNKTKRGVDLAIAQITLRHSRGAILRAEEKIEGTDRDNIKKAILAAVDKMYRQIERFKGKTKSRRRRKGNGYDQRYFATDEELTMAEPVPNYEAIAEEYAIEEDQTDDGMVVRRKTVEMAPMTEEEAIEQMELLGHSFFMFLDGKSGAVSVVYLRDGGGYGVLVPEPVET
jgi:putative sigma-54 modulation protein